MNDADKQRMMPFLSNTFKKNLIYTWIKSKALNNKEEESIKFTEQAQHQSATTDSWSADISFNKMRFIKKYSFTLPIPQLK